MTSSKRKIPATMATQHPDHANIPYWHTKPFIGTSLESEEAFNSFSELGITEYKWDWEGKLVDESVLERFFANHFDFFKQNPLGQERFLTYRLPNPKVETEFRLGRAYMNLASAASVAKHFKLPSPPLFEVINPMTETPEEIFELQVAFEQMHFLKHPLFKLENILTNLRIIPLFEQVQVIMDADKILEKYLSLYKAKFKKLPPYMRPYVARSDPALNSGLIPTVLAIKIALSHFSKLAEKTGIPMYPIIGAAALPFRGGLTPLTVSQFANEYKGIRTTTIQSAFRYDFAKETVIKAIAQLEELLPTLKTTIISAKEEKTIRELIPIFEQYYRKTIENIAPLINTIASQMPRRRERVQYVGLFGYSRGVGKVKLPRAISFTAAMYSIGIPPEVIGTGRSIHKAIALKQFDIIEKYYLNIKEDLLRAGKFLNKENLAKLAKQNSSWEDIQKDITYIEKYLGLSLGPKSNIEKEHQKITSKIFMALNKDLSFQELIEQAALLRKSLG